MQTYTLVEFLGLAGLVISALVFYFYARQAKNEKVTVDGYMLSDYNMTGTTFGNTFASSSLSLATVVLWLIEVHAQYGLFLIWATGTYIIGQCAFLYIAKSVDIDFKECRTISDFWYKIFPSKKIARLITVLMIINAIAFVFIELYVGSIILSFFLPESAIWQTLSFLALGLLVIAYVKMGGYKAIIKTDTWQLWLIILSAFAILLFGTILQPVQGVTNETFVSSFFSFSESWGKLSVFLIWITLINFVLPFTMISNWQRVAAAESTTVAWTGMIKSLWKVGIIYMVPIVGFIVIRAKGYDFHSLSEFLTLVQNLGGNWSLLLYPLIVVGFGAALFSTADTNIIAIMHSLCDKNTLLPHINKIDPSIRHAYIKTNATRFSLLLVVLLSVLYWFEYQSFAGWFMTIIYETFGQVAMLFPLVIYALFRLRHTQAPLTVNKRSESILYRGLFLSWMVILVGSVLGHFYNEAYSQLAFPIGGLLVAATLMRLLKDEASVLPRPKSLELFPLDMEDDECVV